MSYTNCWYTYYCIYAPSPSRIPPKGDTLKGLDHKIPLKACIVPAFLRGGHGAGRVQEVVQLLGEEEAAHERLQLRQAQLRQVRQARAGAHERPVVRLRHALYGSPVRQCSAK